MTPQEIQIAVAEEMGWTDDFPKGTSGILLPYKYFNTKSKKKLMELPPYTTSIDAIREACLERFLPYSKRVEFQKQLYLQAQKYNKLQIELTALDWCEAFLETVK